jgi:hypothetical protein
MSESKVEQGTPSMVLMPSREYGFVVSEDMYLLTIPRKGSYHELDPVFSEESGEFELYNEETGVLYLPAISKVLFATRQYPDLKNNQYFMPLSMVFKEDVVEISGYVLDMLVD